MTVEEVENAKLQKAKTEKLQEALEKAYEYENKTGFVSIMGRPVENPEETKSLTIELFNQAKFFQMLIAFSQGLLTDDFVYSTKEDVNIFVNADEAGQIYQTITEALSELWVENYPAYKSLIDKAETAEEVEAILIDYAAAGMKPGEANEEFDPAGRNTTKAAAVGAESTMDDDMSVVEEEIEEAKGEIEE